MTRCQKLAASSALFPESTMPRPRIQPNGVRGASRPNTEIESNLKRQALTLRQHVAHPQWAGATNTVGSFLRQTLLTVCELLPGLAGPMCQFLPAAVCVQAHVLKFVKFTMLHPRSSTPPAQGLRLIPTLF